MNRFNLLVILAIVIGIVGCKKKLPVACFVEPTGVLEINEPITFKDCSELANEYEYSFGDDEISNEPSPEHTFTYESVFKVTLKVKGDKGEDELTRHLKLVSIPLTNLVSGNFKGTYSEVYSTLPDQNNIYTGGCQVFEKNLKEFSVFLPRGGFETRAIGTNEQLTFAELNNLSPERLTDMKTVTGSYSHATGSLTFTLTGTDPFYENAPWTIRFTGVK